MPLSGKRGDRSFPRKRASACCLFQEADLSLQNKNTTENTVSRSRHNEGVPTNAYLVPDNTYLVPNKAYGRLADNPKSNRKVMNQTNRIFTESGIQTNIYRTRQTETSIYRPKEPLLDLTDNRESSTVRFRGPTQGEGDPFFSAPKFPGIFPPQDWTWLQFCRGPAKPSGLTQRQ